MTSESAFNLGDLNNIIDISNSPFLKNLPLNFIFSIFYDYNKGDKCLLCYDKSFNLFKHLESVSKIQGNTAEIGVYTGVTSKLIHMFTPDKKHYCYDFKIVKIDFDFLNSDIVISGKKPLQFNIKKPEYKEGTILIKDSFKNIDDHYILIKILIDNSKKIENKAMSSLK